MLLARTWHNAELFHTEFAEIALDDAGLRASGVAVGAEPVGYRLEYELTTSPWYVTQRLEVFSRGAGWRRALVLERAESGLWTSRTQVEGDVEWPSPGEDLSALAGALDCDLGLSP